MVSVHKGTHKGWETLLSNGCPDVTAQLLHVSNVVVGHEMGSEREISCDQALEEGPGVFCTCHAAAGVINRPAH